MHCWNIKNRTFAKKSVFMLYNIIIGILKGLEMAIDYISIGSRIKYYRLQNELSQQDLADKAGVSKALIGYIERGEKAPSLETLIEISNSLKMPADELLVDNLTHSNSHRGNDDYYILLDCTPEEATILIKSMTGLKDILRKYTIK